MNKLIYIFVILCPLFGFSQTDTIAHLYTFGGNNNDNAEEIEATTDGGYIVIGSTSSNSSGNTDAYLLKVDSMCNYEWSLALGGTNNDWGYSIKQTFDKGYIIALSSNSYGNGGYDAVLMKRDSLGNFQWRKTYGGQDWDFAYSVVQTYDSGYVFCGETYNNTNGFSDVYIVKTTPLGDTLWTRTFGGALIDKGNSVIETSDSNIVVAGIRNTITDSTDGYLIKLTSNGILLWDSVYGGLDYEDFNGIIETFDGGFVMAGATTSFSIGSDKDYYVYKTDRDGLQMWEQIFSGLGDEVGYDLLELVNNNIFIIGFTEATGGGGKDAKLFLINSGGWWAAQNSSFGGFGDEVIKSISLGNDGSMKMAGFTNGYGNGLNDVLIVSVDTVVPFQQFTVDTVVDFIPLLLPVYNENVQLITYPNPVLEQLNFHTSAKISRVRIIDVYGRIVKEVSIYSENKFNVGGLDNGIYNVLFYAQSRLISTKKIIISK